MNSVQLLGNLVRAPEVRYTSSGVTVASYTVAASTKYVKDGEEKEQTAYINCVSWGKDGEAMGHKHKGDRVFVLGRLNTRSYEAKDGRKVYVTEVVTSFVGDKLGAVSSGGGNFDDFAAPPADGDIPF